MIIISLVPTCTGTTLTVDVRDLNDNSPNFTQTVYEFGKPFSDWK